MLKRQTYKFGMKGKKSGNEESVSSEEIVSKLKMK